MTTAYTSDALATLPADLAALCAKHIQWFRGDADDIITEAFIALAGAKKSDTAAVIFNRARAACRRGRQLPAKWSPLENAKPADPRANVHDDHARGVARIADALVTDPAEPSPLRYRDYVRMYAEQHRCSLRNAQIALKKMLARMREGGQGDLFFGGAV